MDWLRKHNHKLRVADYKSLGFATIYPLSLLYVFHSLLVVYINSTYMERFVSAEGVGALFSIGSAVSVLIFLFFSHALRAVGNVKLTLILALIDMTSLIILGITDQAATAIVSFVVFLIVNPLPYLNIDIFSETIIGTNEANTGKERGATLGLMSVAAVLAPITMGLIIDGTDNLEAVYFVGASIMGLAIIYLLLVFKNFDDPKYDVFSVKTSLRTMWLNSDIRNVMWSHFLLQTFFAWAVIYIPLYLVTEMGFAWDQISYIIAFGLFAYVIFEWPVGLVADRYWGEKEIMALGFMILAVSVSWISFMTSHEVWPWMLLLFITRVGAAFIETTTEVYFFKHTKGSDADTIGFFRLLRPLAALFGALTGSVALLYLPFNLIFVVLGFIMVPGIFTTIALKDTK